MSATKVETSDCLAGKQTRTTVRRIVKEFSSMLTELRADEELRKRKNLAKLEEKAKEKAQKNPEVTKIRRVMPDGSIRISFYEGGKLSSEVRSRPHLVDKVKVTETKIGADGKLETKERVVNPGVSAAELLMFM